MNTQNTPVHIKLWHREFWLMAIANLLLIMSVYLFIPVLPLWLMDTENFSAVDTALSMGVFGVGLYLLGPFCSYLVQRYRRNVVCLWALVTMAGSVAMLYYLHGQKGTFAELSVVLALRLLFGMAFGLAQMVLSSTLIIDTSESFQRTEANYSVAWFGRFALSLGPVAGLLLYRLAGFEGPLFASLGCLVVAFVFIRMIDFPFRAPDEQVKLFSCDRFFLCHGVWLYINLLLTTFVVGLVMTLPLTYVFYAMMMVGFFLALLSLRFVFENAELKSEVVSGLILMGASLLLMLTRTGVVVTYAAPLFIGLGIGIIGSRYLLFFIKLSRHCQRGTSQSMFMLGWETGLAAGLAAGYGLMYEQPQLLLTVGLSATVVSLLMYNLFTHRWFISHKNR